MGSRWPPVAAQGGPSAVLRGLPVKMTHPSMKKRRPGRLGRRGSGSRRPPRHAQLPAWELPALAAACNEQPGAGSGARRVANRLGGRRLGVGAGSRRMSKGRDPGGVGGSLMRRWMSESADAGPGRLTRGFVLTGSKTSRGSPMSTTFLWVRPLTIKETHWRESPAQRARYETDLPA